MSGDTSNDVFLHVQHGGMPGLITEGCFIDWNDLPNVDFDKPYWYANCIRDINYGNKIYAMTGMYNLNILTQSNVLLFNKRICDELQMDYPYQMVLDGTWTVDKFIEMIKNGTRDLNGDTIIDPEVDQFGYWGWVWEQVPALFMGLGGDVLIKDKDNMPVINIETEQNVNIVDTMNEIFAWREPHTSRRPMACSTRRSTAADCYSTTRLSAAVPATAIWSMISVLFLTLVRREPGRLFGANRQLRRAYLHTGHERAA